MKKILPILTLFLIANSYSQEITLANDSKKLGLVSYLTYVKSFSESKMYNLVNDKRYLDENFAHKKDLFNSDYNLLKLQTDRFINQLNADLLSKNRMHLYKCLNKYIKGDCKKLPEKYQEYGNLIEKIDNQLEALLFRKYSGGTMSADLISAITGIVELGHTAITDARDFREKKIQSIVSITKELKFVNLSDLIKKEKPEAEK